MCDHTTGRRSDEAARVLALFNAQRTQPKAAPTLGMLGPCMDEGCQHTRNLVRLIDWIAWSLFCTEPAVMQMGRSVVSHCELEAGQHSVVHVPPPNLQPGLFVAGWLGAAPNQPTTAGPRQRALPCVCP